MKKIFKGFLALLMVFSVFAFAPASSSIFTPDIAEALWAGQRGTINGTGVHIRNGAGTSNGSLGQVNTGTVVQHTGQFSSQADGFWERVQIISGVAGNSATVNTTGWIRGDFIINWHTPSATAPPTITGHPVNRTLNVGQTATFSVTATGNNRTYQWQWWNANTGAWQNVQPIGGASGINTNTLTQTNVQPNMNNWFYRVRVTNAGGSVYSNFANLTVNAPSVASPFIRPLVTGQVTNDFSASHQALDLQNTSNLRSNVLAAAGGTVVAAWNNCTAENNGCNSGAGNYVVLRHVNLINGVTYYTRYLHLDIGSVSHLSVGSWVNQGAIIGRTGRTGTVQSNGHVHFEVHRNTRNNRVNPRLYIDFPRQCLDSSCRW